MTIHYLSFTSDDGWLGCVHIEADSFIEATMKCHLLGINPGGEVIGFELPESIFATPQGQKILQVLDQLITSKQELEQLFGPLATITT